MTVLELDPPPPALRLVSTNGQSATRDHRYRTSAPLYGEARDLYRHVLQFALETGTAVDADALRVVLATKQTTSAAPVRAFSATAIWQLMFVDVVTWCRNRQLDVPVGCSVALIRIVDYLEHTSTFDPHSDSAIQLYDAIDECTGGWVDDHPTAPTRSSRPRRSLRSTRGPKRT